MCVIQEVRGLQGAVVVHVHVFIPERRWLALNIATARRLQILQEGVGIREKTEDRRKVEELLGALWKDYESGGKGTGPNRSAFKLVKEDFGSKYADALTAEELSGYVTRKRGEGYADATISNRLQILTQAFKFAKLTPPDCPSLTKSRPRKGFFTREEFDRLYVLLPEDFRDFCLFGYLTGMRLGEIASLQWADVSEGVIRLPGECAKNVEPRCVVIEDELVPLMKRREEARNIATSQGQTHLAARIFHREGRIITETPRSWITACIRAGLGIFICPKCEHQGTKERCSECKGKVRCRYQGKLFHDFRRTAVRDMVRAGVPETIAMAISGHKTRSIFDRYNIVDESDIRNAMRLRGQWSREQAEKVVSFGSCR